MPTDKPRPTRKVYIETANGKPLCNEQGIPFVFPTVSAAHVWMMPGDKMKIWKER